MNFPFLSLLVVIASNVLSVDGDCDWESRSNFHVVRAILENHMKQNDTILWELAGIFSNKQKPLKQVVVHYQIIMPVNPDCGRDPDFGCEYDRADDSDVCPDGHYCIESDYVWGRYPVTAQDEVFRDLDVCPLVIGDYEQRNVNVYFHLANPPSCNSSILNITAIDEKVLPCGWHCNQLRTKLPKNGEPSEPIFQSVEKETPIDRALSGVTAKVCLSLLIIIIIIIMEPINGFCNSIWQL